MSQLPSPCLLSKVRVSSLLGGEPGLGGNRAVRRTPSLRRQLCPPRMISVRNGHGFLHSSSWLKMSRIATTLVDLEHPRIGMQLRVIFPDPDEILLFPLRFTTA